LRGEDFHGASFSCIAVPQANLNGVVMASEVRTSVKNISGEELVARYHIVVTSTQGRTEVRGPANIKGRLPVHGVENLSLTPFEKASAQDEFPKTCQFTQIQVCPAKPPATFPKGTYYRPFIDGGKECKAVGNITIALAEVSQKAGCAFALFDSVHGEVQDRWGVSIGAAWSHGKSTLDEAKADAYAKLAAMGIQRVRNPPNATMDFEASRILVSSCGDRHGAVAAVQKVTSGGEVAPPGVWEGIGAGTANDKQTAEQTALANCAKQGSGAISQGQSCHVIDSW
jgi:hypothetical protein